MNAVCYIRQFDGQRPLVRYEVQSREWALRRAMMPRFLSQDYQEAQHPPSSSDAPTASGMDSPGTQGKLEAYIKQQSPMSKRPRPNGSPEWFPEPLRERFGMNADLYEAYYRENLEFVRPAGADLRDFQIDEEAKPSAPPIAAWNSSTAA